MGLIPDRIPETGPMSIETRSGSVRIYAPAEIVSVVAGGESVMVELDWENLPHLRACIDQASWITAGAPGEPFQGVVLAVEVDAGGDVIARVPTQEAADRLARLAQRAGITSCFTRAVTGHVSPELAAAAAREHQMEAEGRLAEAERTWQLALDSLAAGVRISFVTVFEGAVSGLFTSHAVAALDAEGRAFRLSGATEWIACENVRFAVAGDGGALAQAAGDLDGLTETALALRLAEG